MNWLNAQQVKAREEANRVAWERRHHVRKRPSKQQQDRLLQAVYGTTKEEMAQEAEDRRQQWTLEALSEPSLILRSPPELTVHEHTFRDRAPEREIGPEGNFSGSKYVPRAFYVGGGRLDRAKTQDFLRLPESDQRRAVSAFDPRAGTPSFVDVGTVRGRIIQPQFDERRRFNFRAREAAKELHPPMHFAAKTALERVNTVHAATTVNDSGAWEEPSRVSGRSSTPHKWRGRDFRANTAPASNTFAGLDGSRFGPSLLSSEPAVLAPDSVHMVLEKALQLRARDRRGDLAGEFHTITKEGAREAAAARRVPFEFTLEVNRPPQRPYSKSLTAAPSTFGY